MSVPKFRMWDGKEMLPNHEIKHYELGVLQGTSYKMMSSTGLLDKQGVEIYVGDIVKTDDGYIQEVVWNRDGFSAKDKDSNDWKIDYDDEVIGNIYENHELLEDIE